jgi:predicted SAM-dependent methyltransferase
MRLTTRIAYKLLPPEVWSSIRNEWKMSRLQWGNWTATAKAALSGRGLRLHLGCWRRATMGWVNVDAFPQPGLDLRWDIRDRFPCPDGVVELVYSEHVLEHLERNDADRLLAEVYRLLQPSGVVRIGVPDAEIYFRNYVEGRDDYFAKMRHLGGAFQPLETPIEVINKMFGMGGAHRFAWDVQTSKLALDRVGFASVTRWPSGKASRPDLCLDHPEHGLETLYVEAARPAV